MNIIKKYKLDIVSCLLVLIAISLLLGIWFYLDFQICTHKTYSIGTNARWGPFAGCQIQVQPGIWIPLDNYRYSGNIIQGYP